MEIVIDGKRGLLQAASGAAWEQVLESVQNFASAAGRIATDFSVGGKPLTPGRREALKGVVPEASAVLEVATADTIEFSNATLEELDALVVQLEELHESASGHVIAGAYKEALQKAEGCFQGWQTLIETLRNLGGLLRLDFSAIQVDGKPVDARFVRLKDAFQKFTEAFGRQDVVRLGDVVQYELKPLLAEWRSVIGALRRPVGGGAAS